MNVRSLAVPLLLAAVAPAIVSAQATPPPSSAPRSPLLRYETGGSPQVVPSFERMLFPPELVMRHQADLALSAEQRRTITDAVKALQNQTVDLQWNLQAEQTALVELLGQRPVQEQAAAAQLNKLMELEATVKRTHLAMLIRIKNALNERQVQQLNELRGSTRYEIREILEGAREFDLFGTTYALPPGVSR